MFKIRITDLNKHLELIFAEIKGLLLNPIYSLWKSLHTCQSSLDFIMGPISWQEQEPHSLQLNWIARIKQKQNQNGEKST